MERIDDYLRRHSERHLNELMEFLRIPSISALTQHSADCRRAAEWLAQRLRALGVPDVRLLELTAADGGEGKPVVYGHWPVSPAAPTVIIYGHYDVQPPDPVSAWTTPPFSPEVRDGKLYGRGASDDKGNLLIPLVALEMLVAADSRPPLNIKFVFEGEEEIGSPNLPEFFRQHRDLLHADLALCADGGMWSADIPALTLGSRGLVALQIDVRTARTDLHSGMHGGVVQNPIHALAALIAGMRDGDGRISVPGFYDDVRPLTDQERDQIAAIPFSDAEYQQQLGVTAFVGEPGYTLLERLWARPTLDVNGIWGGFQGEGTKTVIPATAHAKITCRLVPDQNPERVLDCLENYITQHTPAGCTVSVHRFPGSAEPYLMPGDHPALRAAQEVLAAEYGREPVRARMGGTLPVAEMFRSILGMWFMFFSFGEPDNNWHAPDEFMRLQSFRRGIRCYVQLLRKLSTYDAPALHYGLGR